MSAAGFINIVYSFLSHKATTMLLSATKFFKQLVIRQCRSKSVATSLIILLQGLRKNNRIFNFNQKFEN